MEEKNSDSYVKQRLLEICRTLGLSARSFSTSIGMSPTYVTSLNKDITSSVLNNISINFPTVNIMWIITGKGKPLLEESEEVASDYSFELKRLKLNYDELKEDYLKAIEELALCKDRLKNYESVKNNNVG